MRAWGLVLVAFISGCIIEPPPVDPTPPDSGTRPDSGVDSGVDAGQDGGGVVVIGPGNGGGLDGSVVVIGDGDGGGWTRDGGGGGGVGDGGGGGGGGEDGGGGTGADGGGGGDDKDGGTPEPTDPFPGSGLGGDPGTGVLWLVRIDRGTANLAASYASLIHGLSAQLAEQGFDIRTTGVASLYESRLFWFKEGKDLPTPELQSLLEKAAASASSTAPTACSTAALADLGGRLSSVAVAPLDYPSSMYGQPFFSPVGALLVVVLDHGARPVAYGTASSCGTSGSTPAAWFGNTRDPAAWLNVYNGYTWFLTRSRTRFLFISTSENESYDQLRTRCASMSSFPRTGLDAISPSSTAFYSPFSSGLSGYQAGLGTQVDLCSAVAGDWSGFSRNFAKSWADLLRLPEDER